MARGSTDPDDNIVSYAWAYKSGPTEFLIADPISAKTDVSGLVEGDYVFTLTVTDADGVSSTDEVKITVLPAINQPPVVDAGNETSVVLPNIAKLTGTAADPDGPVPTVKWTKKTGPAGASILSDTSLITDISFTTPGSYVFTLKATDNKGATASDDVIVTVTDPPNQKPVAVASVNSPVITLPVDKVTLDSAGSFDPEGGALTFDWKKSVTGGAGTIQNPTAATTDVTGLTQGNYTFTLTVKDSKGDTGTAQVNVTVNRAQVLKDCGKLPSIVTLFNKLESVDPNNFPDFKIEIFRELTEVEAYFRNLNTVAALAVDEHIEFFENFKLGGPPAGGLPVNLLLDKWMKKLIGIMKTPDFKKWHELALFLYRVLVALSVYIACVQKEDIDVAKMPMTNIFDLMMQELASFSATQVAAMPPALQALLKLIKKHFDTANTNVNESGEINVKPIYGAMLDKLLEVLTKRGV